VCLRVEDGAQSAVPVTQPDLGRHDIVYRNTSKLRPVQSLFTLARTVTRPQSRRPRQHRQHIR